MSASFQWASSGLSGLDNILDGLRTGDNVVWQVRNIESYSAFAVSFACSARTSGRRLIYMRFANHPPLFKPEDCSVVYDIDPLEGFEHFTSEVYNIVTEEGEDTFYVFDCLSDLLSSWATDLMIGNFFNIICPYLFELDTIAYFSIFKHSNSIDTVARIRETTQLFLDVYDNRGEVYVHPLKVWKRYSPTMFLPHKAGISSEFTPVTRSLDAAELNSDVENTEIEDIKRHLDRSDRVFLQTAEFIGNKDAKLTHTPICSLPDSIRFEVRKTLGMIAGRDERMLALAEKVISFDDLLRIKSRLIGSGFIGGKALGMVLARKILKLDESSRWESCLEPHDSFYIGSDVYYTYIVQNGLWKLRMHQKIKENYFEAARELKKKLADGMFAKNIREQFIRMLEYFGQSPIIVRSSSLLEDGFGNAFAGKYESIFCVNQGTPEQRLEQFEDTVKKVFASSMDEDALTYRLDRNLYDIDEQMAILVQRVSGDYRGSFFFPDAAGVGLSYNAYVWNECIDPEAGMLRLVLGLGTRAVNRTEGDYARIVSLDKPLLQPYADKDELKNYSQREMDVLYVDKNILKSIPIGMLDELDTVKNSLSPMLEMCTQRDYESENKLRELQQESVFYRRADFTKFLSDTAFSQVISRMLKKIEEKYEHPVDIEFTVNFEQSGDFKINLLQCRPLQIKGLGGDVVFPEDIETDRILFRSSGNFMGGNLIREIRRIVFVVPTAYCRLNEQMKYEVARTIGRLNRLLPDKEAMPAMLLGPGRWGTTTPSLGVPIRFSEINKFVALGEIAYTLEGFVPELSFGSHFFQDIVELEMFYAAIFPEKGGVFFNAAYFDELENKLIKILPQSGALADVLKVFDFGVKENGGDMGLRLISDINTQRVLCYRYIP